MQDEAARREELASNLSSIEAIRAGRGLSQTSPTALVIRDDLTNDAMDDMRVSRLNILNGAESARQSAEQAGKAASNALTAGYLGAGRSLLDFGTSMAGSMSGGTKAPKNMDALITSARRAREDGRYDAAVRDFVDAARRGAGASPLPPESPAVERIRELIQRGIDRSADRAHRGKQE